MTTRNALSSRQEALKKMLFRQAPYCGESDSCDWFELKTILVNNNSLIGKSQSRVVFKGVFVQL